MSHDEVAGMALSGEFTAESFLKLLSYEPPKYRIPTNLKKRRKQK